jgi:hypothetical protein
MPTTELTCIGCGKVVKISKYEYGAKSYSCSVCRGVITPKKERKSRLEENRERMERKHGRES